MLISRCQHIYTSVGIKADFQFNHWKSMITSSPLDNEFVRPIAINTVDFKMFMLRTFIQFVLVFFNILVTEEMIFECVVFSAFQLLWQPSQFRNCCRRPILLHKICHSIEQELLFNVSKTFKLRWCSIETTEPIGTKTSMPHRKRRTYLQGFTSLMPTVEVIFQYFFLLVLEI